MVVVVQLVRTPDCGSGGRRFESGLPPFFLLIDIPLYSVKYKNNEPHKLFKLNIFGLIIFLIILVLHKH